MKIYKALFQIFILITLMAGTYFGLAIAFMQSLTLGFVILGAGYLINLLTSINTFILNKRSDTLIKTG
jgi:hypothetical protein